MGLVNGFMKAVAPVAAAGLLAGSSLNAEQIKFSWEGEAIDVPVNVPFDAGLVVGKKASGWIIYEDTTPLSAPNTFDFAIIQSHSVYETTGNPVTVTADNGSIQVRNNSFSSDRILFNPDGNVTDDSPFATFSPGGFDVRADQSTIAQSAFLAATTAPALGGAWTYGSLSVLVEDAFGGAGARYRLDRISFEQVNIPEASAAEAAAFAAMLLAMRRRSLEV